MVEFDEPSSNKVLQGFGKSASGFAIESGADFLEIAGSVDQGAHDGAVGWRFLVEDFVEDLFEFRIEKSAFAKTESLLPKP